MRAATVALALGAVSSVSAAGCPAAHAHGYGHLTATASAGASLPSSHPALKEGDFYPAQTGDARSPCPMLNVLANHGFLPRDGKNITRNATRIAMKDGLNLNNDFADLMFDPALKTNPEPNADWFNLDHLNRHNILEHDGSLSRADAYWDDTQVFNQSVYEETLSYFTTETVTVKQAADARMARMITSAQSNPSFFINGTSETISLGETAAYILSLGDHESSTVPLDRVRMMFEQEKLPFELGWTIPNVTITPNDLFNLTQKVIDSTNYNTTVKRRMNAGIHGGIINKRFNL